MAELIRIADKIQLARELGESQFREFKTALQGPPNEKKPRPIREICRDISEALVAFANAEGGELLIGVEDDGTITGVPHSDQQIQRMIAAPTDGVMSTTPLPPPIVSNVTIDGKTVLYFSIDKSTTYIHQTSDGRTLQRKDLETRPISTESIILERKERASREYDRQFVDGADVGDLDQHVLQRARDEIAPGRSPEAFLSLMKLLDFSAAGAQLRRAALLLFASDVSRWHPRCEVRIYRVRGTELKTGKEYNVENSSVVTGALFSLISDAWEELRPYLVETKFGPEGRFEERILYPEDACMEALTNALAHRDYSEEGRGVEIYIFDDRIEVRSPGSLLSNVTIEDLRQLRGVHQSRNAHVARVLREYGYMREMGEGLRRIFHLMRAHDLVEPDILSEASSFTIVLHHKSVFSQSAQRWIDAYENLSLTKQEARVVLLGMDNAHFSAQEIIDALDIVDTEQYRSVVEQLQLKGVLVSLLSKSQVSNAARKYKLDSKRLVKKYAVCSPEQCDRYFSELMLAVDRAQPTFPLTADQARKIVGLLGKDNPYARPVSRGYLGAFQALGLVDQLGNPIGRLRSWRPTASHERNGSRAHKPIVSSEVDSQRGHEVLELDPDEGPDPVRAIYLGNLPREFSVEELRTALAVYGEIVRLNVPKDIYSDKYRGFAFVVYKLNSSAQKAKKEISGYSIGGRRIHVDWARNDW